LLLTVFICKSGIRQEGYFLLSFSTSIDSINSVGKVFKLSAWNDLALYYK